MEEEGEALCRRMTARVRNNQQHLWFSEEERSRHGGAGRRKETARERHRECTLPLPGRAAREGHQTSPNYLTCQGPEIQTVPPQLVSMLRLKTFTEDMRRAAEVELHDPAVCGVCEQEQASLALTGFIRRKKTQLQVQTLKGRLNTHSSRGECAKISQSPSMPLAGFREELLGGDVRVTATWGCLSNG